MGPFRQSRAFPKSRASQAGQILPLSLVCLMLLILFSVMMFKVGSLVLRREQARARADLVAYSAGVNYARCLNLLALSNKPLIVAAAFAWTGVGLEVFEGIQKAQDLFAGIGVSPGPRAGEVEAGFGAAWLVEGSALYLGRQNGLTGKLFWNDQPEISASLLPSLNVRRRSLTELPFNLGDLLGKIAAQGDVERSAYHYHKKGSTEEIQVPADEVKKLRFKVNGKWTTRYRQYTKDGPGKFVSKVAKGITALDVVEVNANHSLTLWALSDSVEIPQGFLGRSLPPVPAMVASSRVRVGGGSMDFWDFNASQYAPFFAPVDENRDEGRAESSLKSLRRALVNFQVPATGFENIDQALRTGRDKAVEALNLALLAVGRALH